MKDLAGLHPEVRALAELFVAKAKSELDLRIIITQTLRTEAEQKALYAQGRQSLDEINRLRKLAQMGPIGAAEAKNRVTNAASASTSFHGYGLAFDIAVTDPTGKTIDWNKPDWNKNTKNDWQELGKLGQSLGLEWGGAWTSFVDIPHYQFTLGWTIDKLKAVGIKPGEVVTRGYK